jgi:hypothetical protein
MQWLARKVKELDYPFLEPLADEATAKELWRTQTQEINLLGQLAYQPKDSARDTSLVTLNTLRDFCRASPPSWLLCYHDELIEGYVHVEPISGAMARDIQHGKSNEADIKPKHILTDYRASKNDCIHLGSIVSRRYHQGELDLEITGRLFVGIADRIQQLSSNEGSPRRVLAVSYPDADDVNHVRPLLELYGFQNKRDDESPAKDRDGYDVYLLDLNEPNHKANELLELVVNRRIGYLKKYPEGVELVVSDGAFTLRNVLTMRAVRKTQPPLHLKMLRALSSARNGTLGRDSLRELTWDEGQIVESSTFNGVLSRVRSALRDAFNEIGLLPPEDPIDSGGHGRYGDKEYRLVLQPRGRA